MQKTGTRTESGSTPTANLGAHRVGSSQKAEALLGSRKPRPQLAPQSVQGVLDCSGLRYARGSEDGVLRPWTAPASLH